jgi:hypothetical protein
MGEKTFLILVVFLLVAISFSTTVAEIDKNEDIIILSKSESIFFSDLKIQNEGEYLRASIGDTSDFLVVSGKPMLPVFVRTFKFSFGTKIKSIEIYPKEISEEYIHDKILPASIPTPKFYFNQQYDGYQTVIFEDENVYSSADFFPDVWYDYKIGCGLDGDERVLYVTIKFFPVRYSPMQNKLLKVGYFDFNIKYEECDELIKNSDNYDMVIISPEKFVNVLQPFVNHKNSVDVNTTIKTTEDIFKLRIFGGYPGRDKAEKIKYFIKDAIESLNVKYVLFVGGRVNQRFKWHVPVRYSNLDDNSNFETSFISDLYFADIYRYNKTSQEYEFDDWDSNGNGIFAEWTSDFKDDLDLYPDVYLGRLACRDISEVKTVVNKIINYENSTHGSDWFKKMILVGGDTFPESNVHSEEYGFYEGEIETNHGSIPMRNLGFEIVELWASNGNLTGQSDVVQAVSKGAGFLYFSGHGNPADWSTHPPDSDAWINGLMIWSMGLLNNSDKLPICVVGGCHNSQFDVTRLNFIKGLLSERFRYFSNNVYVGSGGFWKGEWVYRCWSWNLVRQSKGGSIATIGNTGLGYGETGNNCLVKYDGWLSSHFFYVYENLSSQGKDKLGQIHSQSITDYINQFFYEKDGFGQGLWSFVDEKTIQGWVLLGDPSLKIGGYS